MEEAVFFFYTKQTEVIQHETSCIITPEGNCTSLSAFIKVFVFVTLARMLVNLMEKDSCRDTLFVERKKKVDSLKSYLSHWKRWLLLSPIKLVQSSESTWTRGNLQKPVQLFIYLTEDKSFLK